jgi:hypothetical protein
MTSASAIAVSAASARVIDVGIFSPVISPFAIIIGVLTVSIAASVRLTDGR